MKPFSRCLRYQLLNHEIQDWVQLPTKVEMDAWRLKHEKPFFYGQVKVVTSVTINPQTKPSIEEDVKI